MSNPKLTTVGLIGAGNISRRYVEGISRFPELQLVAVTDAIPAAAHKLAEETGMTAFDTLEDFLANPGIDIVVNITPPTVHADVTVQALRAGKHVYVEKPIAVTLEDAERMRAVATETGRTLGSAPDTFLGSAGQTARRAIDEGLIGDLVAATAFITHSQAERWHPNPTFLFKPGGGPLLDLGPYYVTSLVNLLGPIASVAGVTRRGPSPRIVTAPDRTVDTIDVETTTHASATLQFVSGAVGTLVASFDIWDSHLPKIEIYGSRGTITVPDPNQFDGPVTLHTLDEDDWTTLDPVLPVTGEADTPVQLLRGVGVADLAASLDGQPLRVNSDLALHVLEVVNAIETSSATGKTVEVASRPARPEPRIH